jgi:hypothetical protein
MLAGTWKVINVSPKENEIGRKGLTGAIDLATYLLSNRWACVFNTVKTILAVVQLGTSGIKNTWAFDPIVFEKRTHDCLQFF